MRRRTLRSGLALVAALALASAGAACTEDEPATDLPCEFWVNQFESDAVEIDEVPEEFRDAVRGDETCDEARGSES